MKPKLTPLIHFVFLYFLKSFLKEKKQYMDIEQEQLNVTLTAKEINNLIDHYENKNLVKFDRIK